jgi:hypothetical protein
VLGGGNVFPLDLDFECACLFITRVDVGRGDDHGGWNDSVVLIKNIGIFFLKIETDVIRNKIEVIEDDVVEIIREASWRMKSGVC